MLLFANFFRREVRLDAVAGPTRSGAGSSRGRRFEPAAPALAPDQDLGPQGLAEPRAGRGAVSDAYQAFLSAKALKPIAAGYDDDPSPHPDMYPHVRDAFSFLARIGRGAAFLDTGLHKSLLGLHWAQVVAAREERPVLIFAPLAVAQQFVREGERRRIPCRYVRDRSELGAGVNATNYDRLDRFSPADLAGVVLDESGVLKSFDGATKRALVEFGAGLRFRLCCTATPAPNDHMELGNHSAFLGVMAVNDMLQRWFVNDTSEASQSWRLKGHAASDFWGWLATWAFSCSRPSDLGYSDDGFDLPRLDMIKHLVDVDITKDRGEALFRMAAIGSMNLHREKRLTLAERVEKIAETVAGQPDEPWLIWCHANVEADALAQAIPGSVEVRGSMPADLKERRIVDFAEGRSKRLITKCRIAGWGLNLQHCARMAFVGINYSFEEIYQAIRRCWRFGQERPVEVHIALAPTEAGVWDALMRKHDQHEQMKRGMLAAMRRAHGSSQIVGRVYEPSHEGRLPVWLSA